MVRAFIPMVGEKRRNCEIISAAAKSGNLELIKFLIANGSSWHVGCFLSAAAGGHQALLEFALPQWEPLEGYRIVLAAAEGGHFNLVEWLQLQGVSMPHWQLLPLAARWNAIGYLKSVRSKGGEYFNRWNATKLAAIAAEFGNLEILKWVHSQDPTSFAESERKGGYVFYHAVAGKRNAVSCVEFMISIGCSWKWPSDATLVAAQCNNLEVLKFLIQEGFRHSSEEIILIAIEKNSYDILDWAFENGLEYKDGSNLYMKAARLDDSYYSLNMLKYLKETRNVTVFPNRFICEEAAHRKRPKVVRWCLEQADGDAIDLRALQNAYPWMRSQLHKKDDNQRCLIC